MKRLYLASDNAMNYMIIRDMALDDNDSAIVNWDLSDDEINEAIKKFGADENDTTYFEIDPKDLEFMPFDEIMNKMNNFDVFL